MLINLVIAIFIGLIAGALADMIVKDQDYGMLGDIVIGIIGSIIGSFVFSLVGLESFGFIGNIIVATIGAIILLLTIKFAKNASSSTA
jgi:uncharacterized membrane protein YeaQ/YmgE (transglycosylase-associated protein family)